MKAKENLIKLKQSLEQLETAQEEMKKRKDEFMAVNQYFVDDMDKQILKINELKSKITQEALEEFKEDGNKKRLGGVGIRVTNLINYTEDAAIQWAEQNMPICVKKALDKKTFESFAKTNKLEIVEYSKKTSVTFPKEIKLED